jgi:hypothetical protein
MAAPKGNKYALGNDGGRPRTVSPEPLELIKLGEEMVAWVRANNPIHLKCWYSLEKRFTYKQWETMTQREEFVPYYEEALNLVSINYVNGTINPSIAQRFLRMYFKDLKLIENQDLDEASQRKAKEAQVVTSTEDNRRVDQLISVLDQARAKASKLSEQLPAKE